VLMSAMIGFLGLLPHQGYGQGAAPPARPPAGAPGTMPPGAPGTMPPGAPGTMPPGHPPAGGQMPPSLNPPPPGAGSGSSALVWTAPAGWTKEQPMSAMRRAQYKIQGPGGPAECVVFYFGPGQGGETKANIERWAAQFQGGKDGKSAPTPKTREIKVGDIPVTMVEIKGTYVGGMGSAPSGSEQGKAMLLGAIAEGPDARWFFRAIGPQTTLEPQRASFEKMIKSLKRGQAS
jgi:hypothetical protein